MRDSSPPAELTAGERRKAEAHALLAAWRETYILRGRRSLLLALLDHGTATADDVRAAVELPAELGPKLFGVVPGHLARGGIIRPAGFTKSTRPESHARPVQVWTLADPAAALAWLRNHPEPGEPEPTEPAATDDAGGYLFPMMRGGGR